MIKHYSFDTDLGRLSVYFDEENILALSFSNENSLDYIKKYYNNPIEVDSKDYIFHLEIIKYIKGELKEFTKPIKLSGTDFQLKVWKELLKIPYGETSTYKNIAKNIDCEKGYRAVGGALNKNPISIIVPCHRVIGSSGKLVGFAGGLNTKEKLLKIEKENK